MFNGKHQRMDIYSSGGAFFLRPDVVGWFYIHGLCSSLDDKPIQTIG